MLAAAVDAADELNKRGVEASVWSMHTIKPLDVEAIGEAARCGVVFTLEEHSLAGGLGSAVAEVLAESGYAGVFQRIALPDRFAPCAGTAEYLRRLSGLDAASIIERVRCGLRSRSGDCAAIEATAYR
jgi:transketolase